MYRNFLLFLLLFLIQTGFAFSATVNSTVDPGDGVCDITECTLREALATGDATIDFNLTLPATINLSGGDPSLPIDSNQTIMGPGADMLTVSGINVLPIFIIDAAVANANISGLNIIDGQSAVDGACIINDGVLTISDSTISGCDTMMSGGGIDNNNNLTVNNCLITDNTAQLNGAGIDSAGTLIINNSTISGNDAEGLTSLGGGVVGFNNSEINDSTISGNTAVIAGGGLVNSGLSTMTITNSTISGNSQIDAGGTGGGGLAQGTLGTTNIINSTITANSASAAGGGVNVGTNGTVNIGGSIVANQNSGGDCVSNGTLASNDGNVESGTSCEFMEAGDLQDTDPLLGPLANNGGPTDTHILLPGSLAIDNAGTCGLPNDQRGEPREADACDSGSVEVQKATLTITKDTDPVGLFGFDFDSNIPDEVCTPLLATGAFILDDGDSISCTITEGDYNVTETIPSDNTLTISCETEPADGVTINNTLGTLDFTTLPADTAVDCTFTNVDDSVFALDVVLAGPGTGTVTGPVGVPDNGGIDCPGDCTESYNPGTNVTLAESANAGSEFQGWSGDCNASGQVVINGNRTCVATFKLVGGGDVLNPRRPT